MAKAVHHTHTNNYLDDCQHEEEQNEIERGGKKIHK